MENKEKRICIIISQIDRWIPFEWIYAYLKEKGYHQSYLLLTEKKDTYFYRFLTENRCPVRYIRLSGKKHYPIALFKIRYHLKSIKPNMVHCHFLDASVLGLLASFTTGVPKRIYTRHHGFFHHDYHPKGVWLDKVCNSLATQIIAISAIVKRALMLEGTKEGKINIVHHGFKLEEFESVETKRVNILSKTYNSDKRSPVVGVIARHIELKGIQYIVQAFKKFLSHYPESLLLLANARGSYYNEIVQKLQKHIPEGNYVLIPFEQDVQALYKLFDIYVHVPIDEKIEAFGQTYVEALASGIPSIFTKSGIANDFIQNDRNALVVPFRDSDAIYQSMLRLIEDKDLQEKLIQNGKKDVKELFTFEKMMGKLLDVYLE